eukprot:9718638-Karenia_brevis.AAC.1
MHLGSSNSQGFANTEETIATAGNASPALLMRLQWQQSALKGMQFLRTGKRDVGVCHSWPGITSTL